MAGQTRRRVSKLTTMITPFGRYWWKKLLFGLKVSSEIFQRKLDEALGDLKGVFRVVDDVVVAGCGQTMEEAQIDNQQKLNKTLKRCAEKNIVLNEDKQQTGLTEITFHGHRITKDGVKADEAKVQAIRVMPAPTDVAGVKRLCSMVQYMSRFLPDLAETNPCSNTEGHSICVVHEMRECFRHTEEKPF